VRLRHARHAWVRRSLRVCRYRIDVSRWSIADRQRRLSHSLLRCWFLPLISSLIRYHCRSAVARVTVTVLNCCALLNVVCVYARWHNCYLSLPLPAASLTSLLLHVTAAQSVTWTWSEWPNRTRQDRSMFRTGNCNRQPRTWLTILHRALVWRGEWRSFGCDHSNVCVCVCVTVSLSLCVSKVNSDSINRFLYIKLIRCFVVQISRFDKISWSLTTTDNTLSVKQIWDESHYAD